jgi:hypothetical protein
VNWIKGVGVYEQGLAVRDRKSVQLRRWQDIISMTAAVRRNYMNGIYTGTTHVYSLFDSQNKRLVLNDSYVKVEELAKIIQDSIFPILYERASKQYNSGQTLVFGPVSISNAGLQIGKKKYAWTEIQQVSIHQGILRISKEGGSWFSGARVSSSTIPNLNVLLNLIQQVVGLKGI